jgi:hypothetical protein
MWVARDDVIVARDLAGIVGRDAAGSELVDCDLGHEQFSDCLGHAQRSIERSRHHAGIWHPSGPWERRGDVRIHDVTAPHAGNVARVQPAVSTFSDVAQTPAVAAWSAAVGACAASSAPLSASSAVLGAEVVEAGVQARDALLAALGGEAALLEGLEVALGRVFDAERRPSAHAGLAGPKAWLTGSSPSATGG